MSIDLNNMGSTAGRFSQGGSSRRRNYTVHNGGSGPTLLTIEDMATPFMAELAVRFPDLMNRALRHIGWWLQGTVKNEMRNEAPGGRRWVKSPAFSRFRVLDAYRGKRGKYNAAGEWVASAKGRRQRGGIGKMSQFGAKRAGSRYVPLAGRLTNAVGYKHKPGKMQVDVGWLSRSAVRLGSRFQDGHKTPVTKKMIGLYRVAGIRPPRKAEIEQPKRPVFRPVFQQRRGEIVERIEQRIMMYLRERAMQRSGMKVPKRAAA